MDGCLESLDLRKLEMLNGNVDFMKMSGGFSWFYCSFLKEC